MLLMPRTLSKTYSSRLRYEMINTQIETAINSNPHLQMKIYSKTSGFHPYIVLHDVIRNIFVLVLPLDENKAIFPKSKYRGEFASTNIEHLFGLGFSEKDFNIETNYQSSLFLGTEYNPFGIIICYDKFSDSLFQGALQPDQEDWLFKEKVELQKGISDNTNTVIPIPSKVYDESEINIKMNLKATNQNEEEEIKLNFKGE